MPIFRIGKKDILFIHIPKTGGTSIKRWLENEGTTSFYSPNRQAFLPCVPQHFDTSLYKHLFSHDFFHYTFTIVRNLYNRILSEYHYRSINSRLKNLLTPNLHSWVKLKIRQYRSNNYILDNHIRPQTEFIADDADVFYLEDGLEAARTSIENKIGIKAEHAIPFENKSNKVSTKLEQRTAELMYDFYRRDFETLGYEKNSYQADSIAGSGRRFASATCR